MVNDTAIYQKGFLQIKNKHSKNRKVEKKIVYPPLPGDGRQAVHGDFKSVNLDT
jgi:hypothetical protein